MNHFQEMLRARAIRIPEELLAGSLENWRHIAADCELIEASLEAEAWPAFLFDPDQVLDG